MKPILPPLLALATTAVAPALPFVDLSGDASRHVVIAQGTPDVYQGHPTTLLMPDGKTMFAVWTYDHGGSCGPLKRSDDGGLTWSELLPVPENWTRVGNCPAIYRLTDPRGVTRLFVFAGHGPDRAMHQSVSTDEGKTWSPMQSNGLVCVMPFCTIVPVDGGKRLIGLTNIRRPGETKDPKSNIVAQSESTDGGLTWRPWRILVDIPDLKPCEPELIRSPDGKQLLCLLRENVRSEPGHFITSDDECRTWSGLKNLPPGLHGDRHKAAYGPDGRLVICFRDMGGASPTKNHFVAWVGRYEDIIGGRDGQYKIKLLHSHKGSDCGYPGLELLPDGTFVATTYVKYRPGPEKNSVVSARFRLTETDRLPKTVAPKRPEPPGIVMDDDAATFTGDWTKSAKHPPLVGATYRHDGDKDRGRKTATFRPGVPKTGEYEVRLLYMATSNRATNVPVTIQSETGEKTIAINQREDCMINGVPRALGTFRFAAGGPATITVSNAGADGFVVVDAVQLVPIDIARAERSGERDAGFGGDPSTQTDARAKLAAAVALSPLAAKTADGPPAHVPPAEPVKLAKDAAPDQVDGKEYDVVVIGATGSGIACAVRAAREGCSVLLVQHNRLIGGMMSNGLMQWDALYGGHRAPLFTELLKNIERHYIATSGENSRNHQTIRYTHEHYPIGWAEPSVAEREFNRLVANEKNITLLLGHYPTGVERDGNLVRQVILSALSDDRTTTAVAASRHVRVSANVFVDATYEGDLFALAKVPYRVGREARHEFNEPHAGVLFCNIDKGPAPRDAVEGRLNIRPYNAKQGSIDPTSPFTADDNVQAYNYRFCVTKDPANRILLTEPPPGYDRAEYVDYERKAIATNAGPNDKSHMNSPILPGENRTYPEADWVARKKITQRHLNFALGLMYFLQNDESVPPNRRAAFRQWGLPKDEFADNGHVPYEMYVREARRIVGRHVFSEHDNSVAPGILRAPIQPDSIATTDWYMDSHSCTTNSRPGFKYDGKLILTEESRPAQIPYRSLLPRGVDNMLVPVCLSATHVAWGAVRLEPVWMQTGEAAGFAAALARKHAVTPAALDPDLLGRALAQRRHLISFFNDVNVGGKDPWVPAVQYFGTRGFFHDYDARPNDPLRASTAEVWAKGFSELSDGRPDSHSLAMAVAEAERRPETTVTVKHFISLLPRAAWRDVPESGGVLTRAKGVQLMWEALTKETRP